jgi:hypothetical protein
MAMYAKPSILLENRPTTQTLPRLGGKKIETIGK